MSDKRRAERFGRDVDDILNHRSPQHEENLPPDYGELVELAQKLMQTDFSHESRRRAEQRHRLLTEATGRGKEHMLNSHVLDENPRMKLLPAGRGLVAVVAMLSVMLIVGLLMVAGDNGQDDVPTAAKLLLDDDPTLTPTDTPTVPTASATLTPTLTSTGDSLGIPTLNSSVLTPASSFGDDGGTDSRQDMEAQVRIIDIQNAGDVTSEVVLIQNRGTMLNMQDWQLSDEQGNHFTFPDLLLQPNGVIRVFTRSGIDTPAALYWNETHPIWQEDEVATLYRPVSSFVVGDGPREVRITGPTSTPTLTPSPTVAPSATWTPSPTATATTTSSPTWTPSASATFTSTVTPTGEVEAGGPAGPMQTITSVAGDIYATQTARPTIDPAMFSPPLTIRQFDSEWVYPLLYYYGGEGGYRVVLSAVEDIPAGTVIEEDMLIRVIWPEEKAPPDSFDLPSKVVGREAQVPIPQWSPVLEEHVAGEGVSAQPDDLSDQVTIRVPLQEILVNEEAVLESGERVNIIVTVTLPEEIVSKVEYPTEAQSQSQSERVIFNEFVEPIEMQLIISDVGVVSDDGENVELRIHWQEGTFLEWILQSNADFQLEVTEAN